jgi:hypothetical protein
MDIWAFSILAIMNNAAMKFVYIYMFLG